MKVNQIKKKFQGRKRRIKKDKKKNKKEENS